MFTAFIYTEIMKSRSENGSYTFHSNY